MTGGRHTRKIAAIISIALFIVIFQSSVFGQEIRERFGLSAIGGFVKMVGGDVDRSTIDQWGGIEARYGCSERVGLSAIFGYGWVRARDPHGSQFVSVGGFKTILIPMDLCVNYYLTPDSKIRSYLKAGAGATLWAIQKLSPGSSTFSTGTTVSGNRLHATLITGFGAETFLTQELVLNIGFNYHLLLKEREDTIGFGDDANNAIIELRLSLSYLWGGFRDKDEDGIDDRYDLDPLHKEDYDGFQDDDGAPDLDNDEDGIPDTFDKAPNEAEDIDGFQDEDGKPDLDNDGDGIPDLKDKCPDIPEDMDDFEDHDGCPELDNDKDGIPDSLDKCPNWPEDYNDYLDEDGCPDERPEPEGIQIGRSFILHGVSFAAGSSRLTPQSYHTLDKIFHILIDYPEIEIEIRGYTDNIGSVRANKIISERRAYAVKKYLVNKGISPKRIKVAGYGAANPIADNATIEGRSANRRIEIIRTK